MTSKPEVKALYKIAELCRFAGMSRYRLWRLLEHRQGSSQIGPRVLSSSFEF